MSTLDLAIPESRDVALNLPSDILFQLEQAGAMATEILDERVAQWAEEGWTQRQMAEEMGCSQAAIKRRCLRLGIKTEAAQRGEGRRVSRPDLLPNDNAEVLEPDPEDIFDPDGPPSMYLPDVVADDAEDNLRTQALHWYEQGRRVKRLLDNGTTLQAKSTEDLIAIRKDAALMADISNRLKEVSK